MKHPRRSGLPIDANLFVIVIMVGVLALLELSLRYIEDRLSANVAHIAQIDQLATQLVSTDGSRVLFLGNSLTNNGVDLEHLQRLLNGEIPGNLSAIKLVPDATTIWSWNCILENQFLSRTPRATTVVVGFAWDQLSDQSRILSSRLGAFFCSLSDMSWISKHHRLHSSQIGEFIVAKTFRIFAHRETIRNRILSILVPNYQVETQELNRRHSRESQASTPPQRDYTLVSRMIDRLQDNHSIIVFVAMPVRDNKYQLDPNLAKLLAEKNSQLLDYRELSGINEKSFLDDMHLAPDGAELLTTELAFDLIPSLQDVQSKE